MAERGEKEYYYFSEENFIQLFPLANFLYDLTLILYYLHLLAGTESSVEKKIFCPD